jgi:FkbM family methyltransferase
MAWRKNSTLAGVIKRALLPSGIQTRAILTGPLRGIRMELDLQTQGQLYAGLCEREIFPVLKRFSKGVRSAVDIGAAYGEYTLYAVLKTDAERVIAFEPEPGLWEQLQRNLELNGINQSSRLELHMKFLRGSAAADSVAADSLADWIQPPCLVKMDIEGGEVEVLRAAAPRLLAVPGLRWLIETHGDERRVACESILSAAGYTTRYIPQAWWRFLLPELRGTTVGWLVAARPNELR